MLKIIVAFLPGSTGTYRNPGDVLTGIGRDSGTGNILGKGGVVIMMMMEKGMRFMCDCGAEVEVMSPCTCTPKQEQLTCTCGMPMKMKTGSTVG